MAATTKASRLNLRLREADDGLIREAAAQTGQSVSEFLTVAAVERAHSVLADQQEFVLDEVTWEAFTKLLDEPAVPDSRLVELFAKPQRIGR